RAARPPEVVHRHRSRAVAERAVARLVGAPPVCGSRRWFQPSDHTAEHLTHPEYMLLGTWAGSELMIAGIVALTGGASSPAMGWFAIPIVTLSCRFSSRGVATGVMVTLALMLAVAFGVDANAVVSKPPLLIMPVTV